MDFLSGPWLGTPVWLWLSFLGLVVALLVLDLGVLHRKQREIGVRESLAMSGFYVALGLGFGAWVWSHLGATAGLNYVTGFVIEKSLAMDNVFVIAMIFAYFGIPRVHQHRVLFWGILGVIVLRALMIGLGAALVMVDHKPDIASNPVLRFMKKHLRVTESLHGQAFVVRLHDAKTGRVALHA
ncbi:MAG TPA: TerC family protein, partial [Croceibacterium sp.]|nr:TerC family protein [Croceibacterium sp.]